MADPGCGYSPAAFLRTKQDGCNPQFSFPGVGDFCLGERLMGTGLPRPGAPRLKQTFIRGLLAPLLIHGALAALEPEV